MTGHREETALRGHASASNKQDDLALLAIVVKNASKAAAESFAVALESWMGSPNADAAAKSFADALGALRVVVQALENLATGPLDRELSALTLRELDRLPPLGDGGLSVDELAIDLSDVPTEELEHVERLAVMAMRVKFLAVRRIRKARGDR